MSPRSQDPRRRSDLAKIHIAKKQLGLDDGAYRDMLRQVAGVDSAGKLDAAGRSRVLAHLRKLGFEPLTDQHQGRTLDRHPKMRMARGLWIELADMGVVRDRSEGALQRFVRRMTKVDHSRWCSPAQLDVVIEALKDWRERELSKRQAAERGEPDG